MAKKRMFSLDVVGIDEFLTLPVSAQALYFHLGMRADGDGYVDTPNKVMELIGATEDDLNLLSRRAFVWHYGSGLLVGGVHTEEVSD